MQIKVTITNSSRHTGGKVTACFIYVCGNKFRLTNVQVSLAAVFWMSRNTPPALRDIQKTAAREATNVLVTNIRVLAASEIGKCGEGGRAKISLLRANGGNPAVFCDWLKFPG